MHYVIPVVIKYLKQFNKAFRQ